MDCSARPIVRALLLLPVTLDSGDKFVPLTPPTLSLCMDLIRQTRRQFRGVGRRNPYGLTSGISVNPTPLYHTERLAFLKDPLAPLLASSYLPDERRHFTQPDHTSGEEVSASAPSQVRTGVCPQPRPTLTQHTAVVRDSQSRTATAPAAAIPHHFLDAENAFSEGKEDPPH